MNIDGSLAPLAAWIERSLDLGHGSSFRRSALQSAAPLTFQRCSALRLVEPAGRARFFPCSSCTSRHFERVTYCESSGVWSYDCAQNGQLRLTPRELELCAVKPERLVSLIGRALRLASSELRELEPGAIFELGTVEPIGRGLPWTACVALGIDRAHVFSELLAALEMRISKSAGYVFTTSRITPATPLPRKHRLLRIEDAFRFVDGGLEFVGLPPKGTIGRRRTGSPPGPRSSRDLAIRVLMKLIEEGHEFSTFADAGRAVHSAWRQYYSGDPPALDTLTSHLSHAEQQGEWRRRSSSTQ